MVDGKPATTTLQVKKAELLAACMLSLTIANVQWQVVSVDGYYYEYTVDTSNGGECRLERVVN